MVLCCVCAGRWGLRGVSCGAMVRERRREGVKSHLVQYNIELCVSLLSIHQNGAPRAGGWRIGGQRRGLSSAEGARDMGRLVDEMIYLSLSG